MDSPASHSINGRLVLDYKPASATLYLDIPPKDASRFQSDCQKMIQREGRATIELPGRETYMIQRLRAVMVFDYSQPPLLRASRTEPGALRKRGLISKLIDKIFP